MIGDPDSSHANSALRRAAWWWGPVVLYAMVIFIASSISQPPHLPELVTDKDLHGGLYAGFALVVLRAVARRWDRVTIMTVLIAIGLTALYGISDEFHQSFVPGRTSDIADVRADALGATVATGLAWLVARFRGRGANDRI